MELRRFIRTDIAASAIAHLSVLALIFVFSEVHPFGTVTAEPISVDIVTPDQVPEKEPDPGPTSTPTPPPSLGASSQATPEAVDAAPPPPAPASASGRPQQQAALSPPRAGKKEAATAQPQPQVQPQPQLPAPSPPLAPAASPTSAYTPPEPDLTLKYHVMLGLPEDLPPPEKPSGPADKPGDGIDATASSAANVASSVVEEFRRRLKTCSKLPGSVGASDNVIIKLRVMMAPNGRLARDPILIEASASAKGPLLMQSAISALQACQPYTMLPADRYGEWKVLDLSFSPRDFSS
jgi:hypothetical protein